jgi:SAM-dependent methyltransferase
LRKVWRGWEFNRAHFARGARFARGACAALIYARRRRTFFGWAIMGYTEILRCPVTHQALRQTDDGALATEAGTRYPVRDGVARLLPGGGDNENIGESVQTFYDEEGWQTDDDGLYGDTRAFVDTRGAMLEFTRKCITRLNRHFRKGGKYLLDAGSGPIAHNELLAYGDAFEKRVCVDLSAEALRHARKKLGDRGVYLQGDLAKLPLKDNSIDAVTCNHVLYQLPEALQIDAVREMWRVLKPGGVAVVIYIWWPYAPLAYRLEQVAKRLGWKNRAPLAQAPSSEETGVRHEPHERSWFEAQDWPFRYSYDTFRVVDNPFMRRYISDDWTGRLFVNAMFALQSAAPSYCGKHGAFPAILIHKD